MKISDNDQKGDIGVHNVGLIITKLGWIFRDQPKRDCGIDAIVEIVENNETKGQLLGFQIKSGDSWFKEQNQKDIIFRSKNNEHFQYWLDHALPIIVALHDPKTDNIYWEIVNNKTAINTGKGWKLNVPKSQLINEENKDKIKSYCEYVFSAKDYDFLQEHDISIDVCRRLSNSILLNRTMAKGEILQLIIYLIENLKESNYFRNELVENMWKGKSAQVIQLFIYLTLADEKNKNHICITQWIDPNLDEKSRPLKFSEKEIIDGLVVEWSDNYQENSMLFNKNTLSKSEYLKTVTLLWNTAKDIVNEINHFFEQYQNKKISEKDYIGKIQFYCPNIHQIYQKVRSMPIANLECKDHDQKVQELITSLDNIRLLFSEELIKSRTTENRDYLMKMYLEQFHQTDQELRYEHKKIAR